MTGMTKQGMWALLAMALLAAGPAQAQVVEYIHTDALGTPIAVTDASGTVIERFEYEPYGLQVAGPVEDGPGYTGHVEDTLTGMTYMQQRYYDPVVERFLSVDPVAAYDAPFVMFNRYRYANGNPYSSMDPDGRQAELRDMPPQPNDCPDCDPPPPPPNGCGVYRSCFYDGVRWHKSYLQRIEDMLCSGSCVWGEVSRVLDLVPGDGVGVKAGGLLFVRIINEIRYANGGAAILKTGHYAARLQEAGLDVARTEAIVAREAARVAPNMAVGVDVYGRMRVNGVLIEYGMRKLPDGRINIGTIYPVN